MNKKNNLGILNTAELINILLTKVCVSGVWSRGMIPASGAGGPGFNSRNAPSFLFYYYQNSVFE